MHIRILVAHPPLGADPLSTAIRIGGIAVHAARTGDGAAFQNFTASPGQAVLFAPVVGAHLTITDSVFANNGTPGSGAGIFIQPSGGISAGVVIERTQFADNSYGIVANANSGPVLVEVRYSSVASNLYDGTLATTTGSVASVVVEHSASNQNAGNGIDPAET